MEFRQSSLDPALFFCRGYNGSLLAVSAVHVDDLLMVFSRVHPSSERRFTGCFLTAPSEPCGKELRAVYGPNGGVAEIRLGQSFLVQGRLDLVPARRMTVEGIEACCTTAARADNRSAVGGLG